MDNVFTAVEVRDAKGKRVKGKDGKPLVKYKEGANGTGHTLRYTCGFCSTPKNPVWFRSRRQRNDHTAVCPK